MVDIHTHILPNVDDGSSSIQTSINMLKETIESGVTDVFLTPHFRGKYNKDAQEIKKCFDDFLCIVKKESLPINIYLGHEVFARENTRDLFDEKYVLTLNNSKYVLVEFNYHTPCDITETVYELTLSGYIPIVAHAERYEYVKLADIEEVKNLGGLIQVNAESVIGENSKRYFKRTKQFFKKGLVDFVASDYHEDRGSLMKQAYVFASKKYGKDTAEKVFNLNAQQIIKG